MMGRLSHDQEQFFYSFRLDEAVPDDHPVREIAAVLDLSWVHSELAPYYSQLGRPSIDPVLMIRMLIVGYVFAIRSERALCRDVQVNSSFLFDFGSHANEPTQSAKTTSNKPFASYLPSSLNRTKRQMMLMIERKMPSMKI